MQSERVVKVSPKGQIAIPRNVRKRLGIVSGERLLLEVRRQEIVLRKLEGISLEDLGNRIGGAAAKAKVDVDALVDEAIRWARSPS